MSVVPAQAFGALFTLLTSAVVFLDYRFGGTSHTSEQVGWVSLPGFRIKIEIG